MYIQRLYMTSNKFILSIWDLQQRIDGTHLVSRYYLVKGVVRVVFLCKSLHVGWFLGYVCVSALLVYFPRVAWIRGLLGYYAATLKTYYGQHFVLLHNRW